MRFHSLSVFPRSATSLPWCAVLSLVAVLSAQAPAAQAQTAAPIVGDVEGGEFRPFPIAVTDMRIAAAGSMTAKTYASTLTKVVRDDLALSGAFLVLDSKSFIDTDGLTASTVKFADWQNVGAHGLVKAQLTDAGGQLTVELHGFEVATQKEGLTKSLTGNKDNLRALGHLIADEVYRYYTGEPGPFRTKIAFVQKVQGEKQIFVTDMDGNGAAQVTKGGGLNLLPSFSPDGKTILFTSYRMDNPDLFELTLADNSIKRISSRPGLNTGGRISPDGSKIAITLSQDGNSEIYVLDRAGAISKKLTSSWGIDTSPAWSPDGKSITFVSSRAGNPQLYVMSSDGGEPKRLTFQGNYNQTPVYSPRGTHIAFTARDERNVFDIYVVDLRTNQVKRVTQNQGNNEEPSFSPNGRLLVFSSTRSGTRQLVVSTLDGTKQTVITAGSEKGSPSWGPFPR